MVIPFEFFKAQSFSEGLAVVKTSKSRNDKTLSYINKSGNILFTIKTHKNPPVAKDFSGGFSYVNGGQHTGVWYVTQKGEACKLSKKAKPHWLGPKSGVKALKIIWPEDENKVNEEK